MSITFRPMHNLDKELVNSKLFSDYEGATITNIHRNKRHPDEVYAHIVGKNGEMLVSATLDYCVKVLKERLP